MGQESYPKVPFPIELKLNVKLALFEHELNEKLALFKSEPRNPSEITIARPR